MKAARITALISSPGHGPKIKSIPNDIKTMRYLVGEDITAISLNEDTWLICPQSLTNGKQEVPTAERLLTTTFLIGGQEDGQGHLTSLRLDQIAFWREEIEAWRRDIPFHRPMPSPDDTPDDTGE